MDLTMPRSITELQENLSADERQEGIVPHDGCGGHTYGAFPIWTLWDLINRHLPLTEDWLEHLSELAKRSAGGAGRPRLAADMLNIGKLR